jgi:hypothetical protein
VYHVVVHHAAAHGEEPRHGERNVLGRSLRRRITENSVPVYTNRNKTSLAHSTLLNNEQGEIQLTAQSNSQSIRGAWSCQLDLAMYLRSAYRCRWGSREEHDGMNLSG